MRIGFCSKTLKTNTNMISTCFRWITYLLAIGLALPTSSWATSGAQWSFQAGWHLVSAGFILPTGVNDWFEQHPEVEAIWHWQDQTWLVLMRATGETEPFKPLQQLQPEDGVWLRLNAPLQLEAHPAHGKIWNPEDLEFAAGWHHLSTGETIDSNFLLTDTRLPEAKLWSWNDAGWRVASMGDTPGFVRFNQLFGTAISPLESLSASQGFWLHVPAVEPGFTSVCQQPTLQSVRFSAQLLPEVLVDSGKTLLSWQPLQQAASYEMTMEVDGTNFSQKLTDIKYTSLQLVEDHSVTELTQIRNRLHHPWFQAGYSWNFTLSALDEADNLLQTAPVLTFLTGLLPLEPPAQLWRDPQHPSLLHWCPVQGAEAYTLALWNQHEFPNASPALIEVESTSHPLTLDLAQVVRVAAVRGALVGRYSSPLYLEPTDSVEALELASVSLTQSVEYEVNPNQPVALIQDKPVALLLHPESLPVGTLVAVKVVVDASNSGHTDWSHEVVWASGERAGEDLQVIPLELPASWLQGEVAFHLELDTGQQNTQTDAAQSRFPASGSIQLTFEPESTLRLRLVPTETPQGGVTEITSDLKWKILRYLQAMYPNYHIDLSVAELQQPVQLSGPHNNSNWSLALQQFDSFRDADLAGQESNVFYYGLVKNMSDQDYAQINSSVAGIAFLNSSNPSRSTPLSAIGLAFDVVALEVLVHELGHVHGRKHVDNQDEFNDRCFDPDGLDSAYPYNSPFERLGRLGKVGHDAFNRALLSANAYHDIMSYCYRVWISDYTYQGIQAFQQKINALASQRNLLQQGTLIRGEFDGQTWNLMGLQSVPRPLDAATSAEYQMRVWLEDGSRWDLPFNLHAYDHSPQQWFKVFLPSTLAIERLQVIKLATSQVLWEQQNQFRSKRIQTPEYGWTQDGFELMPTGARRRGIYHRTQADQAWRLIAMDGDQRPLVLAVAAGDQLLIEINAGLMLQQVQVVVPETP